MHDDALFHGFEVVHCNRTKEKRIGLGWSEAGWKEFERKEQLLRTAKSIRNVPRHCQISPGDKINQFFKVTSLFLIIKY